ncbi:SMI1/KNR4 family protein [Paenibacillus chondroitinus]|uniref:SMI1/KNR4 family protein n=1 Tax=Paenibacillus chondroitinus TaxID=59842 RepID=A0ABU6D5R5_9BACL|nr:MULTISPECIES: SMI1/KNR4 family protein [Paenibacillus]MCY9660080.1 SMI1/KNR4 family protein [Paenibacillus anseongense]MEB4793061.1 SMI1/KNR4 family protein [Paenibacillus chondroitinus]
MVVDRLIEKWSSILEKIKNNGGKIIELTKSKPASDLEIKDKESTLGINIPSEFKKVLLENSKQLYLRWSFPEEAILPQEFREIFSGEIGWSLDGLEYWGEDSTEDYAINLKGKLTFFQVRNGDYLALDLSNDSNPPIVYWDHETDNVIPIAASFMEYLNKMTELSCIGAEIWQYEDFLGHHGIETKSEKAERWKKWFHTFQSLRFEDASQSLESLFQYILYHGEVKAREANALRQFNHSEILENVLKRLPNYHAKESKVLCLIIGEVVKNNAEAWVREQWVESSYLDPADRSYLTARCLPFEEGYQLVIEYLEGISETVVNPYDALKHLSVFQSNRVITWLEKNGRLPATNGWSELFAFSSPTWEDINKWSEMETRHQLTLIHALDEMIRERKKPYDLMQLKVYGVPSREKFIDFLMRIHDSETLNNKKSIIKNIIDNVEKII